MAKVSIRHVSKSYSPGPDSDPGAVNDVSLEVANGEFLVLVGPSGCGKSTLLRLVAGLENATGGDIFIGDKRVNDVPACQRDVAMVFQSFALFPHLNAHDNIAFGMKLRGQPKAEIKKRVAEAAAILDLADLLGRKPAQLSGGERQRVALGRAIVRQPRVFLFDEPLSNLDAKTRAQTRLELSRLHQRLQATMIYVTHDQAEAMSMGNRVAVLERGSIQQVEPPEVLYQEPANLFVAGFFGVPPMNLVRGKLTANAGGLVFKENDGVIECRFDEGERPELKPYVGKEIVVGVRPEDIERKEPAAGQGRNRAENSFQCLVDLVEPMGGETNLYLQTGGKGAVVCRVRATVGQRESGHRGNFQLDVARAHLFDPVTGRRITRG